MSVPGGIYPMLYAFFDRHDQLDRDATESQVRAAVASGAQGLAVLGLGTEVNKLSGSERRAILHWTSEALAGRLPLAVTVAEPSVRDAVAFVREAAQAGAAFAILQPPPVRGVPEIEYLRFFGGIADASPIPIAIQNAPDYIGIGLSISGVRSLAQQHPNVTLVKAESSALYVCELIEATENRLQVFNGRCGLELTDNLRAGCHGMIPGIESFDIQARIFRLMQEETPEAEAEAERLYGEVLPMISFMIQSLETFLCYGKRVAARRLGLGEVYTRAPALLPTSTGLAWMERLSARLPPLL